MQLLMAIASRLNNTVKFFFETFQRASNNCSNLTTTCVNNIVRLRAGFAYNREF